METEKKIQLLLEDFEESNQILIQGIKEKDISNVLFNAKIMSDNLLTIGLLQWRNNANPSSKFNNLLEFLQSLDEKIKYINQEQDISLNKNDHKFIYVHYLLNKNHPNLNLEIANNNTLASRFFGNVLMGNMNISEWPKYRDALPNIKRHNLARQTNELYAGLLAGSISHEDGVKLGEQLWAEREDHPYFDTGTGGYGDDNENMVDYQLGAILKKIGSTVPSVHAWRW